MELSVESIIARMEAEAEGRTCRRPLKVDKALESACEYARRENLARDFEEINPLSCLADHALQLSLPASTPEGLADADHLPKLHIPSTTPTEVWTISGRTVEYLNDTLQTYDGKELKSLADDTCRYNVPDLKLEAPTLRSDHKMDCIALESQIRAIQPRLDDHRLPLEPSDNEAGEGLEFARSAHKYRDDMEESLRLATLDVSQETLKYLSEQLKDVGWTQEDQDSLLDDQFARRKQRLTPPLSPMFQSYELFIPEDEGCMIDIPSDPSSHLSAALKTAEDALFVNDAGFPIPDASVGALSPSDFLSDMRLFEIGVEAEDSGSKKLDDLKVEVPLIPGAMQPDEYKPPPINLVDLAKSIPPASPDRLRNCEEAGDQRLWDELEGAAFQMTAKIEQERLQVADAISRIPVPVMDCSIPPLGWQEVCKDPHDIFKWIKQSSSEAFQQPKWRRRMSVQEEMIWCPLRPGVGRIDVSEKIEIGDDVLRRYLERTDDDQVSKSVNFARKSAGLTILLDDNETDEEELKPMFSSNKPPSDLMTGVKKKRQILANFTRNQSSISTSNPHRPKNRPLTCIPGGGGVVSRADGGNQSRLVARQTSMHVSEPSGFSRFFKAPVKATTDEATKATNSPVHQDHAACGDGLAMPSPAFEPSARSPQIILSVALPRGIRRSLLALLPDLSFVERDYTAHNTSVWLPGSARRSEVTSPLAHEADLAISPATGIIFTTMGKIRQRPTPGSQGMPAISDRIAKTGPRYERLVVLVSEGRNDGGEAMMMTTGTMSASEVEAFAELQGLLSGMDTAAVAYYVGGGEEAVARWAASLICRSGLGSGDNEAENCLGEEETPGELLLRHAGMNAYAAQAVAGVLGPAPNGSLGNIGGLRLPWFVEMAPEERISRFEGVLGGRRVLERASREIDARWG